LKKKFFNSSFFHRYLLLVFYKKNLFLHIQKTYEIHLPAFDDSRRE